jgi:hypothetical protein
VQVPRLLERPDSPWSSARLASVGASTDRFSSSEPERAALGGQLAVPHCKEDEMFDVETGVRGVRRISHQLVADQRLAERIASAWVSESGRWAVVTHLPSGREVFERNAEPAAA